MQRFQRNACILLGACALLRLSYLYEVLGNPLLSECWRLDSTQYLEFAARADEEAVFQVSAVYGRLVSVLVAALGPSGGLAALLALQQALGLSTALVVGTLSRRLFGDLAGLVAGGLSAFYAAGAMLEVKVLPTTVATFGTSVGCLLAFGAGPEWKTRGASGLCLGVAALLVPSQVLALPFAVAWMFRQGRQRTAWFLGGVLLALAPVVVRNSLVSGEASAPSGQGGVTFWQGNNPRAEGAYSTPEGFTGNKETQQEEARAIATREDPSLRTDGDVDKFFYGKGLRFLAGDPAHAATLLLRKLRYWFSNDELASEFSLIVERRESRWIWAFPVPFALILSLGGFGLWERRNTQGAQLVGLLLLGNICTALIFFAASRYRAPVVPLLSCLAGAAVSGLWERARKDRPGALKSIAGIAACMGLSLISWTAAAETQAAGQLHYLGTCAFKRGDTEGAIARFEDASRELNRDPELLFNLAVAYAHANRFPEASEQLERVLTLQPGDREAREWLEEFRRRDREQR